MRVWVLTRKEKIKKYQADRLREEAKSLEITLRHVCSEDFEIFEPSDHPKKIFRKGKLVKVPDVLITRITAASYFDFALIRLLKRQGVVIMNDPHAIEIAQDKLRTTQVLTGKNLPVPASVLAKFPVDVDIISEKIGFPLIMKTVLGAKGEGVLLFENKRQFKDVATILHHQTDGRTNLIFQKFIKNSHGRDLRVMVIGNKAIGCAIRQAGEGDFRANVHAGGSAGKFEMTQEISELAIAATKALNLEISGVDLLFGDDKFYIAEVNSSPSFDGFEQVTNINVAKKILQRAKYLAKKKHD